MNIIHKQLKNKTGPRVVVAINIWADGTGDIKDYTGKTLAEFKTVDQLTEILNTELPEEKEETKKKK